MKRPLSLQSAKTPTCGTPCLLPPVTCSLRCRDAASLASQLSPEPLVQSFSDAWAEVRWGSSAVGVNGLGCDSFPGQNPQLRASAMAAWPGHLQAHTALAHAHPRICVAISKRLRLSHL